MSLLRSLACAFLAASAALAAQDKPAGEANAAGGKNPKVKIKTSKGDIVVELNAEKAPVSTLNFLKYVEADYYDGTTFHRIIKDFMVQGGGYTTDYAEKKQGLREPIFNEWQNGLKNVRGSVAMARLGGRPDSATSQFFINVVDNARLDMPQPDGAGYAAFGMVLEGMDVVDKIKDTPTGRNEKLMGVGGAVPVEQVVIEDVSIMGEYDRKALESAVAKQEEVARKAKDQVVTKVKDDIKKATEKAEAELGKKAVTTESGLVYVDVTEGTGASPEKTDMVEVHYTGWLVDGTKFDSSVDRGTPFTFAAAGGVIRGWLEGVPTMKVGGKRRLIIPPDMGYGTQGSPPKIGPNAVLVFDVELLGVKKKG